MKRRELALLLRHPLLQLEGFVLKGRLLFKPPLDRLLRGIFFDSSSDPRAFYPTLFVMPLCVPTNHIYFTFGNRLRTAAGVGGWSSEMPDLVAELGAALKSAAMFLSGIDSLPAFVAYAEFGLRTERTLEGIGYALAREGQAAQAISIFDELLTKGDLSTSWQRELAERITNLRRTLVENPEDAHSQLVSSESETIRSLGLDDFHDV